MLRALADAAHAEADVGVPTAVIDDAVGRSRGDMRTALDLGALRDDGMVSEQHPGVWALTREGIERLREEHELEG